jgi:hypothetical protein
MRSGRTEQSVFSFRNALLISRILISAPSLVNYHKPTEHVTESLLVLGTEKKREVAAFGHYVVGAGVSPHFSRPSECTHRSKRATLGPFVCLVNSPKVPGTPGGAFAALGGRETNEIARPKQPFDRTSLGVRSGFVLGSFFRGGPLFSITSWVRPLIFDVFRTFPPPSAHFPGIANRLEAPCSPPRFFPSTRTPSPSAPAVPGRRLL